MALLALASTAYLPSTGRAPISSPRSRPAALRMQMGETGAADAEMGNTYWASWAEDRGVSSDGAFPPGEDIVEKELKRMFSLDEDEERVKEQDVDDMQACPSTLALPR